ncbi:hypothetical protein [Spartinivicinus poritis]|uniref:Uncharacterized protein n=1 Tax=Spartinivicinus poritis TaxID=2994640 RepID=A0ABT5UEY5_9GAMM|nr:hypothetical protein [Spartinivicinus sp. A2-2]MDE1464947.1 hypothetical protein [Spartinivicinus sp. A2-2]
MKVVARQTQLSESQKKSLGIPESNQTRWQITEGKTYLVISLGNAPGSSFYGNSMLYDIEDDFGKLIPIPADLFEIIDPTPSKYWQVKVDGIKLSFDLIDFIKDPGLSEKILDREVDALLAFDEIKKKLEAEHSN